MAAAFPSHGRSWPEIEAELLALRARDPDREIHGRLTMFSMTATPEVQQVAQSAFTTFFEHNALLGSRMPSVFQMESDLKAAAVELLGGGDGATASITTGGSESIFCAMHAAREWARANKPQIERPEIVAPWSAHAAFSKAAHYMDMTIRRVPVGADYRADAAAMAAAINENTIALVGSAPCWPYGMVDPIAEIAAVAQARGLWMHVDGCVGGYLNPFLRKLGHPLPDFDLSVPGVCSLSADLHKYGFAPKPISTVVYATAELHAFQPHIVEDWANGPYRTEGVVGSRAAGAIAGAWAVMHFLGEEGYLRLAARMLTVRERLIAGLEEIPGLKPLHSDVSPQAWGSDVYDVNAIAAGLRERGWFIMGAQDPPLIHVILDAVEERVIDAYLRDVAAVVADLPAEARAEGELHYAR